MIKAVVEIGGRQYRVAPGDKILVPYSKKFQKDDVTEITTNKIVAIFPDDNSIVWGTPYVPDSSLILKVEKDRVFKKKMVAFKKKRRKGYKRKIGVNFKVQELTVTKIIFNKQEFTNTSQIPAHTQSSTTEQVQ